MDFSGGWILKRPPEKKRFMTFFPATKTRDLEIYNNTFHDANASNTATMRALTEGEMQTLFAKIANYTGQSLKNLIAPGDNGDQFVFRLHQNRVYYVRLSLANLAISVSRDKLLSLGTCIGKFTKTGKFRRMENPSLDISCWGKADSEI